MPVPTYLGFLGIAKEATKGTPVAATDYIPVKSMEPHDIVMMLEDGNMRGAQVDLYDEISGPTYSEYGFGGDVFPDTIGYVVAGLLGDVTTTGASAPFSHAIGTKNTGDGQPTSYTLSDYNATTTRQFPGCQFTEATFKFSGDGLLTYEAKALGFASATTTKPTQSFSAITPIPGWKGAVTIAGGGVTYLVEGELNIKRSVTAVHTVDGTANPYKIWVGPASVSGKLTFLAEDESELTRYLTNTKPALSLDFSQGAAAALTQVKFVLSKCAYTDAQLNRGKDYIGYDVNITGLGNTTDVGATGGYGAVKATIQNAKASGTYV